MKRNILLLIMVLLTTSVAVLASDADLTGKGYQFASVSSGEMLSPLMDVSLDGGNVVKPEGEPFSFWKLNVGDVADFNFRLPMDTDSATDDSKEAGSVTNLQANILFYSEKPGQIARIRWNRQLMTDPATIITTGEPGKFLITIPLPDPKAENQLRILPVTDSILIQSVKLTYSYVLPSSTVGDVTVTLLAPDRDKQELSDPLTFRWRASGPCNNGWISLEYRQQGSEQWQPVPGAESFDRQCPEWPTDDLGSFTWTNHGLKSFPSVKITYHDGESPLVKLRTAAKFFEQAQKLNDERKFDEALTEVNKALELYPDEAKYKELKQLLSSNEYRFQPRKNGGDRAYLTIDGVEFAFRYCPAGVFMMGSPESEEGRDFDETPHQVTILKGFWLMETEVTQKQWKAVMGNNPSNYQGDDLPVERVSWNDCQDFCRKLSSLSGLTIKLPSEAQWEYACRAGSTTAYFWGNNCNGTQANCDGNFPYGTTTKGPYHAKTVLVKSYSANAWGLYDMHGNVCEWCEDVHIDDISSQLTDEPILINSESSSRINRGGRWYSVARNCRSANRDWDASTYRSNGLGFRAVVVPGSGN